MRTNVEIDDSLLSVAMRLAKTQTKKATLSLALEELIKSFKRKKFASLKGMIRWEGDLGKMRAA